MPESQQEALRRFKDAISDVFPELVSFLCRFIRPENIEDLARASVAISINNKNIDSFIQRFVCEDVNGPGVSISDILNSTGIAYKMLNHFFASPPIQCFLCDCLKNPIARIATELSQSPAKSFSIGNTVYEEAILTWADLVLRMFADSSSSCPTTLINVLRELKKATTEKFHSSGLAPVTKVLLNMLISPALSSPMDQKFSSLQVSAETRRVLIDIGRVLQILSTEDVMIPRDFSESFSRTCMTLRDNIPNYVERFLGVSGADESGSSFDFQCSVDSRSYLSGGRSKRLSMRPKPADSIDERLYDVARIIRQYKDALATDIDSETTPKNLRERYPIILIAVGDVFKAQEKKKPDDRSAKRKSIQLSGSQKPEAKPQQPQHVPSHSQNKSYSVYKPAVAKGQPTRTRSFSFSKKKKEDPIEEEREKLVTERKKLDEKKSESSKKKKSKEYLEEEEKMRERFKKKLLLYSGKGLCPAADDDDVDFIREWIEEDPICVNAYDKDEQTVLHHACSRNSRNVVLLLMEKGAKCNLTDSKGWTALHVCCFEGNFELALELCSVKNIDVTVRNRDGNTALHYLTRSKVTELSKRVLSRFLALGADINAKNNAGETPLHSAVLKSRTDMIELLLQNSADPTIVNEEGKSPLDFAKLYDNQEAISLLSDVMEPKTLGDMKPLTMQKIIEMPRTETRTKKSSTATFTESLRMTAKRNANQMIRTEKEILHKIREIEPLERKTLILSLIRKGERDKLLATIIEEPDILDMTFGPTQDTLLHLAIIYPNLSLFEMLLRQKHKFGPNGEGVTPFALSISLGLYEFSRRLLFTDQELGYDKVFFGGNNCLHLLAGSISPDTPSLVFSLLFRGASVNVPNEKGETPLEIAVRCGNVDVVNVLRDCNVRVTKAAVSIAIETHQSSMLYTLVPSDAESIMIKPAVIAE